MGTTTINGNVQSSNDELFGGKRTLIQVSGRTKAGEVIEVHATLGGNGNAYIIIARKVVEEASCLSAKIGSYTTLFTFDEKPAISFKVHCANTQQDDWEIVVESIN